ncbi:hypothetical protein NU50_003133 [Salmonella enterica subsp. salamae]|nr:hypothetical protein [Salmonella enterica subsp. salamae]
MKELNYQEMTSISGANGCPIVHYDAGLGNGRTYYIRPDTGAKVMDPMPGSPGYSSSADYPAVNNAYCPSEPYSNGGNDPNGYATGLTSAAINLLGGAVNAGISYAATGKI